VIGIGSAYERQLASTSSFKLKGMAGYIEKVQPLE